MLVDSKIKIKPYNDKYIISQDDNSYFVANANSVKVIDSLQRCDNLNSAFGMFCESSITTVTFEQYTEITNNILAKLKNKNNDISNQYLHLRFQILSSESIGKIGQLFVFLFNTKLLWSLFSLGIIINILNLIYTGSNFSLEKDLSVSTYAMLLYPSLLLFSPFLHEIGHISACRKFKANHGGFGFGFYFILPVTYSDVSGIWMISKRDRIIVNLAGIYFEIIYSILLVITAIIAKNSIFSMLAILIFLNDIKQLNPLFRYDGYWILSDLANLPNLRFNSRKILFSFIVQIFKGFKVRLSFRIVLLIVYSLISYIFLFVFVFIILFSYTREVFTFPVTIYNIVNSVVSNNFEYKAINIASLFLVSLFYFMLIQFIWNITKVRHLKRDGMSGNKKVDPRIII